jgi:hypothetical protein
VKISAPFFLSSGRPDMFYIYTRTSFLMWRRPLINRKAYTIEKDFLPPIINDQKV